MPFDRYCKRYKPTFDKVDKRMVDACLAITAPPAIKDAVSRLCGVRRRNSGKPHPQTNSNPNPNPHHKPYRNPYPNSNHHLTLTLTLTLILPPALISTTRTSDSLSSRERYFGCGPSCSNSEAKSNDLAKKNEKARLHANKMMDLDGAVQTTWANNRNDLDDEIASFGNDKGALKRTCRNNLKVGNYIAMNPLPRPGRKISNDM
jgi:hypothetical protein